MAEPVDIDALEMDLVWCEENAFQPSYDPRQKIARIKAACAELRELRAEKERVWSKLPPDPDADLVELLELRKETKRDKACLKIREELIDKYMGLLKTSGESWHKLEAKYLAAIDELRELRAWKEAFNNQFTDTLVDYKGAVAELSEKLAGLRAWKERLGSVESWFPSLNQGPPGDFANWSWAVMDEARALIERAKETP